MHRIRRFGLLIVALLLAAPSAVWAQSGTWTNAGGGVWSTTTNWSGLVVANGAGNSANFATLDLLGNATVTLDFARTIGSVTFGDIAPSHNWTVNGAALTLAGGAPTITVNNQTTTFDSAVLATASGFTKAGGGTLVMSNPGNNFAGQTVNITGGKLATGPTGYNLMGFNANFVVGAGAVLSAESTAFNAHNINALTLSGGSLSSNLTDETTYGNWLLNADVTVNGATQSNINAVRVNLVSTRTFNVSDGAVGTDLQVSSILMGGALVKSGAGTMVLTADNIYGGATTINQGVLSISKETNLGIAPGGFVANHLLINGGTLQTTGTFAIDDFGRGVTIGASGGTIDTFAGTLTIARPVTSTAGAIGLTKTGSGTLDLTAANNFTNSALKATSSTINISTPGTYTGATITAQSGGVINLTSNTYNVLGGGANLVIGAGSTISASNSAFNAHNIGTLTLSGGTLTSNGVDELTYGNWLLGGTVTVNGSMQSNITALRLNLNGTRTFDVADTAAATELLVSSTIIGGTLVKTGDGLMQLTGSNIYGVTNVNQGTLSIGNEVNLGTGAITLNGGTLRTTSSFIMDDGGHTITTGVNGGTIETAAGTTLTLAQTINATAGDFFKRGAGTLDLTVPGSTFSGRTLNVMEGTMRTLGGSFNMLGFNQNIFIDEGATLSAANTAANAHNIGPLSMTGGTLTSNSVDDSAFGNWLLNGNVTINTSATTSAISAQRVALQGARTFTVASGAALNVSSVLFNGSGVPLAGVTKEGAGLMTLSGNNQYNGATIINAGTLSIQAENNLGVNPGAFNAAQLLINGGTLHTVADLTIDDFNRGITIGANHGTIETEAGTTLTLARPITSTAGDFFKRGGGTLDLTVVGSNFSGRTLHVMEGTMRTVSDTYNILGFNQNIFIGEGATLSAENSAANAHNFGSLTMAGGTLHSNSTHHDGHGNWLINGNVTTNPSANPSTISATAVHLQGNTIFNIAAGGDLLVTSNLFSTNPLHGNFTKTGGGTMVLNPTVGNNFAGRTINVNGGVLELQGPAGGNNFSGGAFHINNAGTIVNVVAPSNFTGVTINVNAGTNLNLIGSTYNLLGGNPNLAIGEGATASAANPLQQNAHNIGSVTLTGGTLTSNGTADDGHGHWLLNGNVVTNASGTQANITAGRVSLVSAARTFTVADGAAPVDLFVSSQLFGGGLTKSGAGTMVLAAPNNALSVVNVNAGTVRLESNGFNSMGGAMPVFIGDGAVLSASNTANNAHNIAALTMTGGTLTSNGLDNATFGNWLLNGNVTINASATQANISAVRVSLQGTRTFTVADGAAPVDLAVSSILFNGNAIATGNLIKQGAGLMSLSGTNIYNGTTTIGAGTLRVDGTHNGAGSYTVVSGATLGGSGTINLAPGASINVLPTPGIVSPGPGYTGTSPANSADVGTLTVNANAPTSLALDMNGILQIDIVSPLEHDILDIATGVIDIDPAAQIRINGETDMSQLDLGFERGDRVTLLMADQVLGNFSNFPSNQEVSTMGGGIFFGNDGTSLFLLAVPEPASIALWVFIAGVALVGAWRRGRRRIAA